jgi:hypothetical protein
MDSNVVPWRDATAFQHSLVEMRSSAWSIPRSSRSSALPILHQGGCLSLSFYICSGTGNAAMASHNNRQQRDHTAQRSIPGRMSNYNQLDPHHVAHGLRSDYHHPTLRRPIPGRMSNYLEIHQSETTTTDTNLRINNRSRKVTPQYPQYPQYEMLHGVSIESQDSSSTTKLLGGERAIELHAQ